MHIHRDPQKRQNGQTKYYLRIVHNVTERPEGKKPRSKPIVFANLGDEEDLSPEMAQSMLKAFERYFKKRFGGTSSPKGGQSREPVISRRARARRDHWRDAPWLGSRG